MVVTLLQMSARVAVAIFHKTNSSRKSEHVYDISKQHQTSSNIIHHTGVENMNSYSGDVFKYFHIRMINDCEMGKTAFEFRILKNSSDFEMKTQKIRYSPKSNIAPRIRSSLTFCMFGTTSASHIFAKRVYRFAFT